ncbi:unnamed protein product [Clonostachys solani]|uniref:alpha-galactosidase n=1 Tax=Clonostachys solani TaxID=160281 RepID=A0A9N9ZFX4_9HYPO|nr:unnamed protein product [Clonostachys solani]
MSLKLRLSLACALFGCLATCAPGAPTVWQPAVGAKWDINLLGDVNIATVSADIFDFDLFDNTGNTLDVNKLDTTKIDALHKAGKKVICYFSAGSYESWRPDVGSFKWGDWGSPLDGWAGEYWLNLRSPNVASIMRKRIALAARAGCDAIDPDNMDAYENVNGMGMTRQDSINFMRNVLAPAASAAGLAIGLKNGGSIISSVLDVVQFEINEQCAEYAECSTYLPFIKAGKPVFHIEYPGGDSATPTVLRTSQLVQYCSFDLAGTDISKFSTVLKTLSLNRFLQTCDGKVKYV